MNIRTGLMLEYGKVFEPSTKLTASSLVAEGAMRQNIFTESSPDSAASTERVNSEGTSSMDKSIKREVVVQNSQVILLNHLILVKLLHASSGAGKTHRKKRIDK